MHESLNNKTVTAHLLNQTILSLNNRKTNKLKSHPINGAADQYVSSHNCTISEGEANAKAVQMLPINIS
jgi:hypothetical protein